MINCFSFNLLTVIVFRLVEVWHLLFNHLINFKNDYYVLTKWLIWSWWHQSSFSRVNHKHITNYIYKSVFWRYISGFKFYCLSRCLTLLSSVVLSWISSNRAAHFLNSVSLSSRFLDLYFSTMISSSSTVLFSCSGTVVTLICSS